MQKPLADSRIVVVDLLRGCFLFAIVVNHLSLFPNLFVLLTGGTRLWVSFASGFFFVSGFILAHLLRLRNSSMAEIAVRTWRRGVKIYVWSIFMTIFITLVSNLLPPGTQKDGLWIVENGNWGNLVAKILSFQYIYGYADFLPYYTIFLFISPVVFWGLRRLGVLPVLTVSFIVWSLRGQNVYMAQQIVFVLGAIAGERFEVIQDIIRNTKLNIRKLLVVLLFTFFGFSLILSIISTTLLDDVVKILSRNGRIEEPFAQYILRKNDVLNLYFVKNTLGFGRLVLFPIWHGALFLLVKKFENVLSSLFGGLFVRWGRNSLFVFIVHAVLAIPVPVVMRSLPQNMVTNSLMTLIVLWVIDVLVKIKNKHLPQKSVFD